MRHADGYCAYKENFQDGKHSYTFMGPCIQTGKAYSVTIPAQELYAYRRGAMIQDAMPSVKAEDREFLMSGYSPEGWKEIFSNEEDEVI